MNNEQLYWNRNVGNDVATCGSLSIGTTSLRYIKFHQKDADKISTFIASFGAIGTTRSKAYPLIAKGTAAFAGGYFGQEQEPFFSIGTYAGLNLTADYGVSSSDLCDLIKSIETVATTTNPTDPTCVSTNGDSLNQLSYPETKTASYVGIFTCMWYNDDSPVTQPSFKVAAAQTVYQKGTRRVRMGYWAEEIVNDRFTLNQTTFKPDLLKDENFLVYPIAFTSVDNLLSAFPTMLTCPTTIQTADVLNGAIIELHAAYDEHKNNLDEDTEKRCRDTIRRATDFITEYASSNTTPVVYTITNNTSLSLISSEDSVSECNRTQSLCDDIQRELGEEQKLKAYIDNFSTNQAHIMTLTKSRGFDVTNAKISLQTAANELKELVEYNNSRLNTLTISDETRDWYKQNKQTFDQDVVDIMRIYWGTMGLVSSNKRRFRVLGIEFP